MPTIKKSNPGKKKEELVLLKTLKPGEYVRFPTVSYEDVVNSNKDTEPGLWMVIKDGSDKPGRVKLVAYNGSVVIERDDDRQVVHHEVELHISPCKMV